MHRGITLEEYLDRDQNRHFNYVANGALRYVDDHTPEGRLRLTAFLQTLDIIRKNARLTKEEPPSLYEDFKLKESARCGRVDEKRIAAEVANLLRAGQGEMKDHITAEANRIIDAQGAKQPVAKRRYNKPTMATLKRVAEIWLTYRFNADMIKVEKGRKVSKAAVFNYFATELTKMGVKNAADFAKAVDNARKQLPDMFREKKRPSWKNASRR